MSHSDTDENQSEISVSPISNRYDHNKLMQMAPQIEVIMSANTQNQKLIDKYEVLLFEKIFKMMKDKYEDIVKVLRLYSEVIY